MAARESRVRRILREEIACHPDPLPTAVLRAGVTRKTVQRHLCALRRDGDVLALGPPRRRRYRLAPRERWAAEVAPTPEAAERALERCDSLLADLPDEPRRRVRFGLGELLDNARRHAPGQAARLVFLRADPLIELSVADRGPGLLDHLVDALGLEDERHAALELSKGSLSTVPGRPGRGVATLLAAFDTALWWSGSKVFGKAGRLGREGRVALALHPRPRRGTTARLVGDLRRAVDLEAIRAATATRSTPAVELAAAPGGVLRTRREAERLLAGCERFPRLHLDLAPVVELGREFCDEVFVRFPAEHPDLVLTHSGESDAVLAAIEAARGAAA